MNKLTESEAWLKASRLLKLSLGFEEKHEHALYKVSQEYDDKWNLHYINLKLRIKMPAKPAPKEVIYETNGGDMQLLKELLRGSDNT